MKLPKLKFAVWSLSIPIIALAALCQLTFDLGEQGRLDSKLLRENLYSTTRTINGIMTNVKFRLRGEEKPKQKIVIIAADSASIEKLGRWPWHREIYAHLIHATFKMGARFVGLDMVLSEPEERIPPEVYALIKKSAPQISAEVESFEGDPLLAEVVQNYRNKLVLGYTPEGFCQPRYDHKDECPIERTDLTEEIEKNLSRFSTSIGRDPTIADLKNSSLMYMLTSLSNIPLISNVADNAGFFFVTPDPDGYIRRYPLYFIHRNRIYPSLALKLAELARGDTIQASMSDDLRFSEIKFSRANTPLPTTPLGYIDLNFRGKAESFTYLSALDVLQAAEQKDSPVRETLKDSIVIFGATALGVFDMRAFPFDSNTPGVEGHATALDNLLSNDSLKSASGIHQQWLPLFLIIVFGLLFAVLFSRFEAVPSLCIFVGFTTIFGLIDLQLFKNQINLPSAFLLLEIFVIFAIILAARYIAEERNKKFVRLAFSRYLSPQVVDLVLKDPSKLAVGGERKSISILFSDLRGFTTLSETMDPKLLSQFLNEYLTEMTEIVFEYGGTLDKYIGDAVMAFWGAPLDQPEHALNACLAGLKMQKRLKEIAADFKNRYNVTVAMGVGINSGVVSVGNMGSERIFEYTVIGDHVNLASRLEGMTKMYGVEVLSTRDTLELIPAEQKNKVYYRVIDSVKAKGKTQATDILELSLTPFSDKALELFYLGREEFKKRNWDIAKSHFENSAEIFKSVHDRNDPVCEIFIERCEYFQKNPPPEDWNGTVELRSK